MSTKVKGNHTVESNGNEYMSTNAKEIYMIVQKCI